MRPEAPSYSPASEFIFVDHHDPDDPNGGRSIHKFRVTLCGNDRNAVRVTNMSGYAAENQGPDAAALKTRVDALEAGNARLWNAVRRLLHMCTREGERYSDGEGSREDERASAVATAAPNHPPAACASTASAGSASTAHDASSEGGSIASESKPAIGVPVEDLLEANEKLEQANVRLDATKELLAATTVRLDGTAFRLDEANRNTKSAAERLHVIEREKGELLSKLATAENMYDALLNINETLDRDKRTLSKELDAAKAEVRKASLRCSVLDKGACDLRRSEQAAKCDREKLRVASGQIVSERDRYRSENAKLKMIAKDLGDAKTLADAMHIRASEAEARLATAKEAFQAEVAALKLKLGQSLERNKSNEERHARNMASALSMIGSVITESEKRVSESARDALQISGIACALKGALEGDGDRKTAENPDESLVSAMTGLEQTRAAGIILCIAVITQGATDVRECFIFARRIPRELLTKAGSARRLEAYDVGEECMRDFASLIDRLCVASRGVLKIGRHQLCPDYINEIYWSMLDTARLEMFDPAAMARLAGVLRDMAGAMRIGLHMAEAKAWSKAALAVNLPNPSLELCELMETVATFEEAAPGADDEEVFQAAMRKWQDNLGVVVPWRATAERAIELA